MVGVNFVTVTNTSDLLKPKAEHITYTAHAPSLSRKMIHNLKFKALI
jgi:hypothetical protein